MLDFWLKFVKTYFNLRYPDCMLFFLKFIVFIHSIDKRSNVSKVKGIDWIKQTMLTNQPSWYLHGWYPKPPQHLVCAPVHTAINFGLLKPWNCRLTDVNSNHLISLKEFNLGSSITARLDYLLTSNEPHHVREDSDQHFQVSGWQWLMNCGKMLKVIINGYKLVSQSSGSASAAPPHPCLSHTLLNVWSQPFLSRRNLARHSKNYLWKESRLPHVRPLR